MIHVSLTYLMALAGLFLLPFGCYFVWLGFASKRRPTVQGVVIKSMTDMGQSTTSSKVVCEYNVDGKKHACVNQKKNLFNLGASYKTHQQFIDDYPKGKTVKVHYNPRRPQTAFLKPGISAVSLFIMALMVSSFLPIIFLKLNLIPSFLL